MRTPTFWRSLFTRAVFLNALGYLLTFVLIFTFIYRYQYRIALERMDSELLTMAILFIEELENEVPTKAELNELAAKYSAIQGNERSVFHVYGNNGTLALSKSNLPLPPPRPTIQDLSGKGIIYRTTKTEKHAQRWVFLPISDGQILQVGYDLDPLEARHGQFLKLAILTLFAMFVLGTSLGGWFMSRGLGSIKKIANAASEIRDGTHLDFRVPTPTGSTETDVLANTFNQMLGRIQYSVSQLREAMDNIAHDLKTPIMRIQAATEQDEPLVQKETILKEIGVMKQLLEDILEISTTELGARKWQIETCDLVPLLEEGCSFYAYLAEDRGQRLEHHLPASLPVTTDVRVIQRILSNLLDNALKYSEADSKVTVHLAHDDRWFEIRVIDEGHGISEEDRAKVFDRFFRAEPSRGEPGHGLGLSYCKATVQAMGGTIECVSKVGVGTEMRVRLPLQFKLKG